MSPWPCAVFVITGILVSWEPLPVTPTIHAIIATITASLAFAAADSLNDRSPR